MRIYLCNIFFSLTLGGRLKGATTVHAFFIRKIFFKLCLFKIARITNKIQLQKVQWIRNQVIDTIEFMFTRVGLLSTS